MELDDVAFGDIPGLCHINPSVSTAILNHAKWMIEETGDALIDLPAVAAYGVGWCEIEVSPRGYVVYGL